MGQGTMFKQCGCRDEATGKLLGRKCPNGHPGGQLIGAVRPGGGRRGEALRHREHVREVVFFQPVPQRRVLPVGLIRGDPPGPRPGLDHAAAGGVLPRNRDPHPGGGDQPSGDRTDAGHEPVAERLSADRTRPGALLQHQPPRRRARAYCELSDVPWSRSAALGPLSEQHGDRHRDGRRRPCGGDRRAGRAEGRAGHELGSGGGGGGVPCRVDGTFPSATAVSERAAPFKAAVPYAARRILTCRTWPSTAPTTSATKDKASMIRRYIIWRNNHAYDARLRRIIARAHVA